MRWIKKPPRDDRLWFLLWPLECKMGPKEETGMSTDHKMIIWLEFVRITREPRNEYSFRIMTRKGIGYDYHGQYFKNFKDCMKATRYWLTWLGIIAAVVGIAVYFITLRGPE